MAGKGATYRRTGIISCVLAGAMAVGGVAASVWMPNSVSSASSTAPVFTPQSYPRVDGSTVTQPLGVAFQSLFTGTDVASSQVVFNKTHQAYLNLINGDTDLILVTSPSQDELDIAAQAGVELEVIPVVDEGFVFLTNADNPVTSLTVDQIRRIYAGSITNWNQVGGPDEPITAYQRPVNSGSQTGMEDLVMQGTPMVSAPLLSVATMDGLVDAIANFNGGSGSLGYSYYYYVTQMYGDLAANPQLSKIKLMGVNGVQPSAETIRSGQYPLQTGYYIVINKADAADSPARVLANAMLGHDGQQTAMEAGYVPVDESIELPQPTAHDPNALDSPDETYQVNPLTFTTTQEWVMSTYDESLTGAPDCARVDRVTISGLADQEMQDQINARFRKFQNDFAGLTTTACDSSDDVNTTVQNVVDASFSNVLSLRTEIGPIWWVPDETDEYWDVPRQSFNVRLDTGADLTPADVFTIDAKISGMIQLEAQGSDGFCDEECADDKATTYLSDPDQPFGFTAGSATIMGVEIPFGSYWPQVAIFKKYAGATGLYTGSVPASCPVITTYWSDTYQACLPFSAMSEDLGIVEHVLASTESVSVDIPADSGERWFAFAFDDPYDFDVWYQPDVSSSDCSTVRPIPSRPVIPSWGTGPATVSVTLDRNQDSDSLAYTMCVGFIDPDTQIGHFGTMTIQQDPIPPSWVVTVDIADGTVFPTGDVRFSGTLTDLAGNPVIGEMVSVQTENRYCQSETYAEGQWACMFDEDLSDGQSTITVMADDYSGQWGQAIVTITVGDSNSPASPSPSATTSPTSVAIPSSSGNSAPTSTVPPLAPTTSVPASAQAPAGSAPTGGSGIPGSPWQVVVGLLSLLGFAVGITLIVIGTRRERTV